MSNSIDRRALLQRGGILAGTAWIAPAIVGSTSAAALTSCAGTTSSWGPFFGTRSGLSCDNRGTDGYNCADNPPATDRDLTIPLTDMTAHTSLSISGLILVPAAWEASGGSEDLFMIHVGNQRVLCTDDLSPGNILGGFVNINVSILHDACDETVYLTACVTDPGAETWAYVNLQVTVT